MTKQIKVLVLNNYSFDSVWEEVKQGLKPASHLYGIDFLEKEGMQIAIVPFRKNKFLLWLSDWLERVSPIPFGDLDQQWSALKSIKSCDLIYAPCQTQVWLLSYLKYVGIIKKPLVVLAHHPFTNGRLAKLRMPFLRMSFAATNAYPALSNVVSKEINAIAKKELSEPIFWGPQLDFFVKEKRTGNTIVVSGRTGRDFVTFGNAASKTNVPCTIICLKHSYREDFDRFSHNVQVKVNDNVLSYKELEELYLGAKALAIPFEYSKNLCGLTSLTDALALGKAVLMTRTEFIDIDLEKEGIGIWVDPADEEGWVKAINKLGNHGQLAEDMGIRARKFAEDGHDYNSFCLKIKSLLLKVLAERK